MLITVDLPSSIFEAPNPGRAALELLAIEGYRSEALSPLQTRSLLGLSRYELDGFLKSREMFDHAYGVDDLMIDLETTSKRS